MQKKIYFAGGCFWGVEEYFSRIEGVVSTQAGYANGKTPKTSYYELSKTHHAEAVEVTYDTKQINLAQLIDYFFAIIDPFSLNRQGNDIGVQYRTGIYFVDTSDLQIIKQAYLSIQKQYDKKIAVEIKPLENFVQAEEYHQRYLKKHPNGYCHINLDKIEKPNEEGDLIKNLTPLQYKVTQENGTEEPFNNKYYNNAKKGIYVDILSGEPLFSSTDKYDSGSGWPSFTKPINAKKLQFLKDNSLLRERVEVRSENCHLGHVFEDGPQDKGGMRYCINSAALRFIPLEEMQKEGYGNLVNLIK